MCGLTGYLEKVGYSRIIENHEVVLQSMTNALIHRGPDDEGIKVDHENGIYLGHRRLSIQDLSKNGHQPMLSHSKRYLIAFNGEVYNFKSLRDEIKLLNKDINFMGGSDTEVILAAIETWGIKESLNKFNGMFAFALFDKQDKKLFLARDRVGEKPLYYGFENNYFLFSSELKSLRRHPSWTGRINKAALSAYLKYSFVPTPLSIYDNFYKLEPGHLMEVSLDDFNRGVKKFKSYPYWDLLSITEENLTSEFKGSLKSAISKTDDLLQESVDLRTISDVPVGTFLSGGIDSSLISSIASHLSSTKIQTFSVGFNEEEFNEAKEAKEISNHLSTDHYEIKVSEKDLLDDFPYIATVYDEPFADSSQLPTYLISKFAKQNVTVVLSGDGGDELFFGYGRYKLSNDLWTMMKLIPYKSRKKISKFLQNKLSNEAKDYEYDLSFLTNRYSKKKPHFRSKVSKFSEALVANTEVGLYDYIMSSSDKGHEVLSDFNEPIEIVEEKRIRSFKNYMMYSDQKNYLPDDILVKVDRASMAVSLESRLPFLDHNLLEWAWRIPINMKYRGGSKKFILKKVLEKYLPKELIKSHKQGFAVPLNQWLRGPLQEVADQFFTKDRLNAENLFDAERIILYWEEHKSGIRNWGNLLWNILVFLTWYEDQKNESLKYKI